MSKDSIAVNGSLEVSIDLTNDGERAGEEVVQLYIRDKVASTVRPIKELKGFQKVMLQAGETKTIAFTIDASTLAFYSANKKWEVEPGAFVVMIGGDSKKLNKLEFSVQ